MANGGIGLGVPSILDTPDALAPWFGMMEQRLNITDWPTPPNENNDLLRRGAAKLGIPSASINRNVKGCWNLGSCGMGCPTNAKQSMLVTTIPAALDLGATSSLIAAGLLMSIGTLAIDFVIMGFAHSVWLLFLGRILSGISGATHSTAAAYIADVTEPKDRGRAFGMLGAAFGLGAAGEAVDQQVGVDVELHRVVHRLAVHADEAAGHDFHGQVLLLRRREVVGGVALQDDHRGVGRAHGLHKS